MTRKFQWFRSQMHLVLATASFFHVKIGRREPKSRTIETDHADKSKGNTKIINLRMDKVEKRTYLTSFYSCSGFYGNFNYHPNNCYFQRFWSQFLWKLARLDWLQTWQNEKCTKKVFCFVRAINSRGPKTGPPPPPRLRKLVLLSSSRKSQDK